LHAIHTSRCRAQGTCGTELKMRRHALQFRLTFSIHTLKDCSCGKQPFFFVFFCFFFVFCSLVKSFNCGMIRGELRHDLPIHVMQGRQRRSLPEGMRQRPDVPLRSLFASDRVMQQVLAPLWIRYSGHQHRCWHRQCGSHKLQPRPSQCHRIGAPFHQMCAGYTFCCRCLSCDCLREQLTPFLASFL
jgi:hypothetical protein